MILLCGGTEESDRKHEEAEYEDISESVEYKSGSRAIMRGRSDIVCAESGTEAGWHAACTGLFLAMKK